MKIGNREFAEHGATYVMGILNVTPDSFSDGGRFNHLDDALRHVEEMCQQGVDVLDIGGESTRPGYTLLPDQEEIDRVVPVIRAVKERFDLPISLDTYKSKVAQAGLEAGADLINDIWGLKYDPALAGVIAAHHAPCCLMHNRKEPAPGNGVEAMCADLEETLSLAQQAGIGREQIILDPGVGFGKTYEQNLSVLRHLDALHRFDLPVLLGTSRKSVIGLTLDVPTDQRLEGTLVTTVRAVEQDCMFVRVHDVQANVRAIRMARAILEAE
jgi:dihydropteroate synthase